MFKGAIKCVSLKFKIGEANGMKTTLNACKHAARRPCQATSVLGKTEEISNIATKNMLSS